MLGDAWQLNFFFGLARRRNRNAHCSPTACCYRTAIKSPRYSITSSAPDCTFVVDSAKLIVTSRPALAAFLRDLWCGRKAPGRKTSCAVVVATSLRQLDLEWQRSTTSTKCPWHARSVIQWNIRRAVAARSAANAPSAQSLIRKPKKETNGGVLVASRKKFRPRYEEDFKVSQ